MTHAFVIECPACAAGYLLPRNLLGPLGARVTCPACREPFDVDAEGALERPAAGAAEGRPLEPRSDAHADERAVARQVLDELAERIGDALAAAAREHRLFRDHGRELIEAFDEYRARAGRQAGAQAFREELLRRWHVDLFPLAEVRG